MAAFDPEKFEEKYVHYFAELQQAYRNAFETMNEAYDSELIHAIDQAVLAESEPFYEGDGDFRIELPEEPAARVQAQGLMVEADRVEAVIETYVGELEAELRAVFGFDADEPEADA